MLTSRAATTTVSSKGQVVLPASIRHALGIGAGDVLTVEIASDAGGRAVVLKAPSLDDISARLERGYRWLEQQGDDPVEALHDARRIARATERPPRRPRRRRRARAA